MRILGNRVLSRIVRSLIKEAEIGGSCSTHEADEKCMQNFVGKTEGKRPLGRRGQRWEGNVIMDVRKSVDGIHLA
jgi:hypothetical protein